MTKIARFAFRFNANKKKVPASIQTKRVNEVAQERYLY